MANKEDMQDGTKVDDMTPAKKLKQDAQGSNLKRFLSQHSNNGNVDTDDDRSKELENRERLELNARILSRRTRDTEIDYSKVKWHSVKD